MERQAAELIGLGEELAGAKDSALYRFLTQRAMEDAVKAAQALETIDAESPKEIRDLQARIYRARSLVEWVDNAIAQARSLYEYHATNVEGE